MSDTAVKARLRRGRLRLRERLNKYFSKRTAAARADLVTLGKGTGRLPGPFAEYLDHLISQTS